jgi:CBS domain-containing protein
MTEHDISAIMIVAADRTLVGIVTERDITRRIVAARLDPGQTRLAEIMTENPETVAPGDSASYALRLMQVRKCRHLPVIDEGRVVGLVSLRDLRTSLAAKTYSTDSGLAARILAKNAKTA